MDEDYELIDIALGDGYMCSELVSCHSGKSHIEEWSHDPKKRQMLQKLIVHLRKICQYGITTSCRTDKLRMLDSKTGLYEIKGFDGVNREMSCCITEQGGVARIALLFPFRGHQGGDKIKPAVMERGKELSCIAKSLMKERSTW